MTCDVDEIDQFENGVYMRFRTSFLDPSGSEVLLFSTPTWTVYYDPSGLGASGAVASGNGVAPSGHTSIFDGLWQSSGSNGLYRFEMIGQVGSDGSTTIDRKYFILKTVVP